ncbi:hypothetical protein J4E91_004928 [Alternaria rosae]|nr:hypothetical protein J4E91_004928 [Alternaria rosae]
MLSAAEIASREHKLQAITQANRQHVLLFQKQQLALHLTYKDEMAITTSPPRAALQARRYRNEHHTLGAERTEAFIVEANQLCPPITRNATNLMQAKLPRELRDMIYGIFWAELEPWRIRWIWCAAPGFSDDCNDEEAHSPMSLSGFEEQRRDVKVYEPDKAFFNTVYFNKEILLELAEDWYYKFGLFVPDQEHLESFLVHGGVMGVV